MSGRGNPTTDSVRSVPSRVGGEVDDDRSDDDSVSEDQSSRSSPSPERIRRRPWATSERRSRDRTSYRQAYRRASISSSGGVDRHLRQAGTIRTRRLNRRLNDEFEPPNPVETNLGVLNIGVNVSDHAVFKLFRNGGEDYSISGYKKYSLQNRALDDLVIASVSRVAKGIDLKASSGADFTWTAYSEKNLVPESDSNLWIHGQTTRLSTNKFTGMVINIPQLNAAEKALAAALLENSKLDPSSHRRPSRQPDPSARRADVADFDMDQERQPWALFLNIPYLSVGNSGITSASDRQFVHSQPLIQHLYPLEAVRSSSDKQQILHKSGVLPPASAILVSQFWSLLTSSGPLVTFCAEPFTSLHQPYLSSSTTSQPTDVLGLKKIQVRMSSNSDFAFTFPLGLCASYFGLRSCITDALQSVLRDQPGEYSIRQLDQEIDEYSWVTLYMNHPGLMIELEIIEEVDTVQRSQSVSSLVNQSYAGIAKNNLAAATRSGVGPPPQGLPGHYLGAGISDDAPHAASLDDIKAIPFLMWSDEIEGATEDAEFFLRSRMRFAPKQRGRRTRTRAHDTAAPGLQSMSSQPDDGISNQLTAAYDLLSRIEKQLPHGSRDIREVTKPRVSMKKSLAGQTLDSFYRAAASAQLSLTGQSGIENFIQQYTASGDDHDERKSTWQDLLAEMMRNFQTIADAFCPSEYKHPLPETLNKLMQQLFADVKTVFETTERLSPLSADTSGRNNGTGGTFSQPLITRSFDGPVMFFNTTQCFPTRENQDLVKTIFESGCQKCKPGAAGTKFVDSNEAFKHLREEHNLDTQLDLHVDLEQYLISAADFDQFEIRGRLLKFMHEMKEKLGATIQVIRSIQAGSSFNKDLPSCIFVLPPEMTRAYEILATSVIHLGHVAAWTRFASTRSTASDKESPARCMAPYFEKIYKLHEHGTKVLLGAKQGLKYESIPPGHMSLGYYDHMGMAYVLALTIGGLCDRADAMNGLDILQAYDDYAQRIDYQVKRHPRRRIRNDIIQCREELETILGVFEGQRNTMEQLRALLEPSSFEDPTPGRRYKNQFENAVLERFRENSLDREEYCKALLEALERLEIDLIRGIEIDQDDHGKAILAFTIVTVIFLPLGFATSFLGMNTTDIRDLDASQWLFWAIAIPLTFLTMGGSLLVGYYGENIRERWSAMLKSLFPKSKQSKDQSDAIVPPLPSQPLDYLKTENAMHATGIDRSHKLETV